MNDFEIFRNDFSLKVDKSWDSVVFNQQCGEEEEISWAVGQGKVELYVEEFKVCEKWFFLDNFEIEEEIEALLQRQQDRFDREQPKQDYYV